MIRTKVKQSKIHRLRRAALAREIRELDKEIRLLGGIVFIQRCRVCGCTECEPCEGGCWWVEEDLCSACVDEPSNPDSENPQ